MAPAYGAAFGGIDNDQPEIKARQRHRARLDPKPKYPSKDCRRPARSGSARPKADLKKTTTTKKTKKTTGTSPSQLKPWRRLAAVGTGFGASSFQISRAVGASKKNAADV